MMRACNPIHWKAASGGGAFRVLLALLMAALWIMPVAAQSSSQKAASSNKATAKPTNSKKSPKKKTSTRSRRARGQSKPTTDRITEIQAALVRAGHYAGEPNGAWDSKSVSAMKSFQEAKGLRPTGKLDARSLQLLGLGSETAGLAAPREPIAATSTSSQ